MRKFVLGSSLALAALVAAPRLQAQAKPEFGAFAGVGLPMGDFGDAVNTGWRVGGLVQLKPAALPVALRAEVGYQGFGGKNGAPGGNILDVTANAIYDFAAAKDATTSFYVIGGPGIYNISDGGGTKFGLNGGGGINFNLSGFKAFAEARFHTVFTEDSNTNIIPLTFGIRF
jgi:hypothetical protein